MPKSAANNDPMIGPGGGPTRATILPTDPKLRKKFPIATGVLEYFPDAIAAIAYVSYIGNEQHNPGMTLRWTRGKSDDHSDTMIRHFEQRGTMDFDNVPHSWKMLWRAAAIVQMEFEANPEIFKEICNIQNQVSSSPNDSSNVGSSLIGTR